MKKRPPELPPEPLAAGHLHYAWAVVLRDQVCARVGVVHQGRPKEAPGIDTSGAMAAGTDMVGQILHTEGSGGRDRHGDPNPIWGAFIHEAMQGSSPRPVYPHIFGSVDVYVCIVMQIRIRIYPVSDRLSSSQVHPKFIRVRRNTAVLRCAQPGEEQNNYPRRMSATDDMGSRCAVEK